MQVFNKIHRNLNLLLVPMASICFGLAGPATAIALKEVDIAAVVTARCLIACVVLGLYLRRSAVTYWNNLSSRGRLLTVLSGQVFALHLMGFVAGIRYTSFVAAMTLVALEPIGVVIAGFLIFKVKPTFLQIAGMVMAVVGSTILGCGGSKASGIQQPHTLKGDLLVLLAVALYSVYFSLNRSLKTEIQKLPSHIKGEELATGFFVYLSATVGGLFWSASSAFHPSLQGALALLILGIVPTLFGHTLCQIAARRVQPIWVALVSPGESLGAILIGIMLLGVLPTLGEIAGGCVIIAGVVVVLLAQTTAEKTVVMVQDHGRET